MRSTLSLEKEWLEGLHRECLPGMHLFPEEIRVAIDYSSRKLANPLFPLLVKWILEPAGVPQTSIVPLAYSVHLLEVSSSIIDHLTAREQRTRDRRFETLHSRFGDALCILCVDAMVTMSFQLLTELPAENFLELSDLLIDRFGANGVLGKKVNPAGGWKGDMLVVSVEASSKIAAFDQGTRRVLMRYARKASRSYRALESSLGEPPGREVMVDRGNVQGPPSDVDTAFVRATLDDFIHLTKKFGMRCGELHQMSEGVVELFTEVERSLSRLEEKEEAAPTEEGVR